MRITKNTPQKIVEEIGSECTRCGYCCSRGSGCLAPGDEDKIAKLLRISVKELKEKYLDEFTKFNTTLLKPKLLKEKHEPYGPCIFFDKETKGCRIHEVKPTECRVASYPSVHGERLSLWFAVNYFVNSDDPQSIREFASYLNSGGRTLEGAALKDFVKDPETLKKILNYEMMYKGDMKKRRAS